MVQKNVTFDTARVRRLLNQVEQVSEDTNRLRANVNGKANSWDSSLPMMGDLHAILRQLNRLTEDAENLQDVARKAIQGVERVQQENARGANEWETSLRLLAHRLGIHRGGNIPFHGRIPSGVVKIFSHFVDRFIDMFQDELSTDPYVKSLEDVLRSKDLSEETRRLTEAKIKAVYKARNAIAKAQAAYQTYAKFGNKALMDQAHKHAEANRKRLKEFGVDEQFYEVGKELSDYFDGSAAEACSYDPMYDGNVKMMPNNQYKYLVGLAAAGGAKGAWAKQQLEGIKEIRDQMTGAGKQVLSSIGERDWRKALQAVGQFVVGMQQLDKYQLTPKPPKPPAALPNGTVIDAYNSRNETTFEYWRTHVMKDPDKVDILRNPDLEYQEWLYATYGKTEWRKNVEAADDVLGVAGAFFRGAVESVASGVVDTVKFGYQVVTDPIVTYKEVKGAAVYVINNPNVVWEAGVATYDQFVNGTAEERAEMLGAGVSMFLGGAATKAVGGVSKGAQSLNAMSNTAKEVAQQTAKQIDNKTKELDQKIKTELKQFGSQLQFMFSEKGSLAIAGIKISIPDIPDVDAPDLKSNVHKVQGPNGSYVSDPEVEINSTNKFTSYSLEKVDINSPGIGGDLARRSIELRKELPKEIRKQGNFGLAQVNIDGIRSEFKSSSRVNEAGDAGEAEGYSLLNPESEWSYTPRNVNIQDIIDGEGAYPRKWDTEFKILEDITRRLASLSPEEHKGRIDLYTDREPCASCSPIIEQFKAKYPNIEINVYFVKELKR